MSRIIVAVLCLAAFAGSVNAQQKELRVLASSPHGVITGLDQSQTIFATFSEPMVALQAVPKDEGTGPMTIDPPLGGKFRWMGTITLSFIPAHLLPYATQYTVKIPAGTASLKGAKLARDESWTFETPRPMIAGAWPGGDHVDTASAIVLRFNQPVDPAVVARFISIQVVRPDGRDPYPAFTSASPAPEEKVEHPEQVVVLKTRGAFGMLAAVTVRVKEGLTGTEGPLPMSAPYGFSFSTWGELKFLGLEYDGVPPGSGITLKFSNGVTAENLLKHLSFTPSIRPPEDYYHYTSPQTELGISLPLPPIPRTTDILPRDWLICSATC